MIEYALLASCVAIVCVGGVSVLGENSRVTFDKVSDQMAATQIPGNSSDDDPILPP